MLLRRCVRTGGSAFLRTGSNRHVGDLMMLVQHFTGVPLSCTHYIRTNATLKLDTRDVLILVGRM